MNTRGSTSLIIMLKLDLELPKSLVITSLIIIGIVIIGLIIAGLVFRFSTYEWTISSLTAFLAVLTIFLLAFVYIEEFWRPRQPPVKLEAVPSQELGEDEKFAFHVENITGRRISGGSQVAILPRNFRADGHTLSLYRFPLPSVRYYLLGNLRALENRLKTNCPLYCQFPAALERGKWRGYWATYLDVSGGDQKKKISTKPFQYYYNQIESVLQEVRNQLFQKYLENIAGNKRGMKFEEIGNKIERELDKGIRKVKKKYQEQVKKYEGEEIERPENLTDCIFPIVEIDEAEKLEIELKNINTFCFKKENDEWVLVKS